RCGGDGDHGALVHLAGNLLGDEHAGLRLLRRQRALHQHARAKRLQLPQGGERGAEHWRECGFLLRLFLVKIKRRSDFLVFSVLRVAVVAFAFFLLATGVGAKAGGGGGGSKTFTGGTDAETRKQQRACLRSTLALRSRRWGCLAKDMATKTAKQKGVEDDAAGPQMHGSRLV
ncbi:uncharacterized protein Tco025E_09993, partial [Trypanosoma conorhini]